MRRILPFLALMSVPMCAAQSGDSLLGITVAQGKNGASLGVPMQIVLLLTALTMLPAILMSVTPFLRSVVVLHFLRQALGTQTTPSNQVLVRPRAVRFVTRDAAGGDRHLSQELGAA